MVVTRRQFGAEIEIDLIEAVDAYVSKRGLVKWRFLSAALRMAMTAPTELLTQAIAGDIKGIDAYFADREAAWAEHVVRQQALPSDATPPTPLADEPPAKDGTCG